MTTTVKNNLIKAFLYRYVFYKHFYKFVFLHKPLCDKYRNFSFKVANIYFCKSCALLYLGFICAFGFLNFNLNIILSVIFWAIIGILSYPEIYRKFSRSFQLFIRFCDGVALGVFFILGFRHGILSGFVSIIIFFAMRKIYNKKRKNKDICEKCSNLVAGKTCEGYKRQKEALIKIEEEYSDIISRNYIQQKGLKIC